MQGGELVCNDLHPHRGERVGDPPGDLLHRAKVRDEEAADDLLEVALDDCLAERPDQPEHVRDVVVRDELCADAARVAVDHAVERAARVLAFARVAVAILFDEPVVAFELLQLQVEQSADLCGTQCGAEAGSSIANKVEIKKKQMT